MSLKIHLIFKVFLLDFDGEFADILSVAVGQVLQSIQEDIVSCELGGQLIGIHWAVSSEECLENLECFGYYIHVRRPKPMVE